MNPELQEGYEAVYSVTDYWDGPRSGVANFKGEPHVYKACFDRSADDYSDIFLLCPIDQLTLELVIEAWNIWLRWEKAFHAGRTKHETHPALPEDRQRHDELKAILEKKLEINCLNAVQAYGDFKILGPKTDSVGMRPLQVKWTSVHSAQRQDEIFDVVNDQDEVIGQNTRGEVHRLGLKHRAVHVLVFNARGELFLQKRSLKKDTFPGAWDSSASGHLDHGEEYDACAVRELREEIGLVVERAPARLFRIEACADTGQEFVWVYRLEAEGPFTLHPTEIETGGWFTPEKITRWMAERPGDFARALVLIWGRFKGIKPNA